MAHVLATSILLVATRKEAEGIFNALDERPKNWKDYPRPGQLQVGYLAELWASQPEVEGKVSLLLQGEDADHFADKLTKSHPALSKRIKDFRKGEEPPVTPTPLSWREDA